MESKELRIGNYVHYKGNYSNYKGKTQLNEYFFSYLLNVGDEWDLLEPILINEDWLLKFGFPQHRNTMDLLWNYTVCLERQHNELYIVQADNVYVYKIEYVHQLQNIYFDLTGQELTLKTKI